MDESRADGIEILLWPHPRGWSAFAAPWVFDLEYDTQARATIDASFFRLNVGDYPSSIDRYRVLDGPARSRILKAALARREDYLAMKGASAGHLVRHRQPVVDRDAFVTIAAAFVKAWRREHGLPAEPSGAPYNSVRPMKT